MPALLLVMVFGVSWALTGVLRRYALQQSVIDVPNERSSHDVPTPRGGGLSVPIVLTAVLLVMSVTNAIEQGVLIGVGGGGVIVAAMGFWDDHADLPRKLRLLIQFGAAIWAMLWLDGAPAIPMGTHAAQLGPFGFVIGTISIVWMTNLFNFMDGIDAITGIETITVSMAAATILLVTPDAPFVYLLLALAAATMGFLVWNWPPAKVFMGDGGSSYIGFVLAAVAIATSHAGGTNLWAWLVLLGVFVVDATVTLLVRMIRRERWYDAHRTHAYQHAARALRSHLRVSLSIGAINLFWLFPLAWLASRHPETAWWLAPVALLPLVMGAIRLRAGQGERVSGGEGEECSDAAT